MRQTDIWTLTEGEGPLVAAAIHDGHAIRPDLRPLIALSEEERRREEDPYTGPWTEITGNRIVASHSRFQVDLNRPADKAVYRAPDDAWGLRVWNDELPDEQAAHSLAEHAAFYRRVREHLEQLASKYGYFFVFDLHTYNHRRAGPGGPAADPDANPEVNIGTGTMAREKWAPVVDRLIDQLRRFNFLGRRLDVRENVKFRGGYFPRWIHETFPTSGCAVAIEFKKFFMDEWTGQLDPLQHEAIQRALQSAVPVAEDALYKFSKE
ncbi:MAG: N-formylglutamate amidohydrolase [Candidatus Krumholzibacteria bacterium]|nr:N-formylglutamate amidohydrolase [Candidatus Krumholzibacteria bacterium]